MIVKTSQHGKNDSTDNQDDTIKNVFTGVFGDIWSYWKSSEINNQKSRSGDKLERFYMYLKMRVNTLI